MLVRYAARLGCVLTMVKNENKKEAVSKKLRVVYKEVPELVIN